ncbi:hypothetical protein QF022_002477 [Vogesella perlucida]|nr:hypothetical protein [Vogesella perlucida]
MILRISQFLLLLLGCFLLMGCTRADYLKEVSYRELAKVQQLTLERDELTKMLERYLPPTEMALNQSWRRLKRLNERLHRVILDEALLDEQHEIVELQQLHDEIESQVYAFRLNLEKLIPAHQRQEYLALMDRFDDIEKKLDDAQSDYFFAQQKYLNELQFNLAPTQKNNQ